MKEVIFKYKRNPDWSFSIYRIFKQIAEFVEKNKEYPTIIELPVYEYCFLKSFLMDKNCKSAKNVFGVKEIRISYEKEQYDFTGV